jgi:hypothetical protein
MGAVAGVTRGVFVLAAIVVALTSTAGGATSQNHAPLTLTKRFPLTPTATTPALTSTAAAPSSTTPANPAPTRTAAAPSSTAPTTATATGSSTATPSRGAGASRGGPSPSWLLVPIVAVALLVGTVIVRRRSGVSVPIDEPDHVQPAETNPPPEPGPDAAREMGSGVDEHATPADADVPSPAEERPEVASEVTAGAFLGHEAWQTNPDDEEPRGPDEAYRRAVRQGQAAVAAHFGTLLEEEGDLVSAEAAYRTADEHGDGSGALNLGRLLADRGDLADAEAAYRRAAEFGPPEVVEMARWALLNLGIPVERAGAASGKRAGRPTSEGGVDG